MVHLEDTFALFDARFHRLAAVVKGEPGRQVRGDGIAPKCSERAIAQGLARVKALQGKIDRVRTVGKVWAGQATISAFAPTRVQAVVSSMRRSKLSRIWWLCGRV